MDQFVQALDTANQLVVELRKQIAAYKTLISDVNTEAVAIGQREVSVTAREKALGPLEEIQKSLVVVQQARDTVNADRIALENDRVTFANFMVQEGQRLRKESDDLIPMRELANQVRQDKAQLEIDKAEYKEKIKAELLNQLKAGILK